MLDDREPESRAATGAAPARIHPIESLGEARDVRGGDADTGVTHGEVPTLFVTPPAHCNRTVRRRVFGCVFQQIAESGMELCLDSQQAVGAVHDYLHVARLTEARQQVAPQAPQQPTDIDRLPRRGALLGP